LMYAASAIAAFDEFSRPHSAWRLSARPRGEWRAHRPV